MRRVHAKLESAELGRASRRRRAIGRWGGVAGALLLGALACYELSGVATLLENGPEWTGAGRYGISGPHRAAGLAGEDLLFFDGGVSHFHWVSPLSTQFGGPYVLTSIAQTTSLGHHEHSFLHGNRVGETDELRLLYTFQSFPSGASWVDPLTTVFHIGSRRWDIRQICDLAAAETHDFVQPHEAESHLFASVRACDADNPGTCAGAIVELSFNQQTTRWWVRSYPEGTAATVTKPDGTLFSNECMPISVTAHGDQTEQILVVGDPSMDQISVYEAERLFDGLIDHQTRSSSLRIRDISVEGRRDGVTQYAFVAALWGTTGDARLEHTVITNGDIASSPHLTEPLSPSTQFIGTLGLGAEGTSGFVFTFGDDVDRRRYEQ